MIRENDPTPDNRIDRLVREHLERKAESVDGSEMLRRVQGDRLAPRGDIRSRSERTTLRRWSWGLASAAVVFLAIFLGLRPGQVSAETILREAQQVHAVPVDRCYHVTIAADLALLEKFPWLAPHRDTRLWTRGDQFWIESVQGDRPWAWGRDDKGRVWFALLPRLGLRFSPLDVPAPLAHACDVRSVRLETMLRQVLSDFDVSWGESTGHGQTIRAKPKGEHGTRMLRGASLQVNAQTRVVERLVLERQIGEVPLATVTFQLTETRAQPGAAYQLEGHVESGATILGRERMGPGKQLLKLLFGNIADKLP